jgi:hypothetical protein
MIPTVAFAEFRPLSRASPHSAVPPFRLVMAVYSDLRLISMLGTLSGTFHSFSMEQTLGTVVTVRSLVRTGSFAEKRGLKIVDRTRLQGPRGKLLLASLPQRVRRTLRAIRSVVIQQGLERLAKSLYMVTAMLE